MRKQEPQLQTAQDILDSLRLYRADLKSLGVEKIGLFGSYARNEATPDSDIDCIVSLSDNSWTTYTDVLFFLEELFGRQIDLIMLDALKPRIKQYILDEVVYAA